MTRLLLGALKFILVVMVFTASYQWWRPLPDTLLPYSNEYKVPDPSVRFFADYTYVDKNGERKTEQEIWDQAFTLIDGASHFMLFDLSLFNDFQSQVPETTRALSHEFARKISDKLSVDRHIAVALIADPVNTLYGGILPAQQAILRKAGVVIIEPDLGVLRDPNLLFSSLWRPFFSWWGNSNSGGWLPHPYQSGGNKVTLRTWLHLLNLKADERNLFVVDQAAGKGMKATSQKMVSFITSAVPADGASADGNVALEVRDGIWKAVIENERRLAQVSGRAIVSYDPALVLDETGPVQVQLLSETMIRDAMLRLLAGAKHGDMLQLVAHHLSERDIITAIIDASNRGAIIRIILDPGRSEARFDVSGLPNRPVAKELVNKSLSGITIRWCDTQREQCRANLFFGHSASSTFMMLGSADLTRRDVDGFNLTTDILASSDAPFTAWNDGASYFNRMWDNKDGSFTTPYEVYADNTFWRSSVYRMMERTGLNTF